MYGRFEIQGYDAVRQIGLQKLTCHGIKGGFCG